MHLHILNGNNGIMTAGSCQVIKIRIVWCPVAYLHVPDRMKCGSLLKVEQRWKRRHCHAPAAAPKKPVSRHIGIQIGQISEPATSFTWTAYKVVVKMPLENVTYSTKTHHNSCGKSPFWLDLTRGRTDLASRDLDRSNTSHVGRSCIWIGLLACVCHNFL